MHAVVGPTGAPVPHLPPRRHPPVRGLHRKRRTSLPRLRSATAIAGAFVVMGLVTVGWAAAAAAATDNPAPTPTCTHEVETVGYPKPAPSCTPDKPSKPGYAVDVVCRPDPHHVILQIVNRTHEDADFTLRLVGGEETVEGTVPAKDDKLVKVSWMSPHDRWLLRIDHEWLKVKAGEPKDCHKPSHSRRTRRRTHRRTHRAPRRADRPVRRRARRRARPRQRQPVVAGSHRPAGPAHHGRRRADDGRRRLGPDRGRSRRALPRAPSPHLGGLGPAAPVSSWLHRPGSSRRS